MKYIIALFTLLMIGGCSGAEPSKTEITVSAAASLKEVLQDINDDFQQANPNIRVSFNFGGSGTLRRQILQGAPADLFFSAAEDHFEELKKEGLVDESHSGNLAGNEMVLITAKDDQDIQSFQDLPNMKGPFSIGTPESVPAGKYAKEALKNLKLWEKVSSGIVYGKDVRQVLTYVSTGNAQAGIVYRTDAASSGDVKFIAAPPAGSYSPIVYPLGILKQTSHPQEAKAFYEFLRGEKAAEVFEKYGFSRVNGE
ncbi:molybdate ABC transporter substrate-binding protein [Metabacillus sp. 113a]|uniref:molybdate ABC transporter substrate-binding protein n=1 Tax=Metabacillus sp. 113a TaxID=3404706 RepID=UPI003CE6CC93